MIVLTVLDFEDGRVYQYEIDTDKDLQAEDFENIICDQGHNLSDCEWMSHSDGKVFTETIEL
tara:strand:+ start:507 stop:692 length:186 start_codon:yes stop_codon:yes gene_type:complete